jgi:hypothetical protein
MDRALDRTQRTLAERRGGAIHRLVAIICSIGLSAPLWAAPPEAPASETPPTERAAPPADALAHCIDAFGAAQGLRRAGKLQGSRAQLVSCARQQCPARIADKCVAWLGEVDEAMPTVVVAARDASGRDLFDVRVIVDGELLTERLDGRAHAVDPGPHRFRFEHEDMPPVERQLLVVERDKGRRLDVAFTEPPSDDEPPAPMDEEPPARAISPVAWVGLGLGVAGIVVGAVTGAMAASRLDDIEAACTTEWRGELYCLERQGDAIDEGRMLADVSTAGIAVGSAAFAIGITALVVSLVRRADDEKAVSLRLGPSGLALSGAF